MPGPPGRGRMPVSKPTSTSRWKHRLLTRKERGQNRQTKAEVSTALYVLTSTVPSDEASDGLLCVIPPPQQKVNQCLGAELLEGQSPYLFKLVPRIVTETCSLSTRYILVRAALTETMPGGGVVPSPHGHLNIQRCHTQPQGSQRHLTQVSPLPGQV